LRKSCLALSLVAAAALTHAPAHADERNPFNGPYVGLHAGYSWQSINGVFDNAGAATNLGAIDLNGAILGGQLGYNVQSGWFLFGIEGDGTALADASDAVVNNPTLVNFQRLSGDLSYLASIRGRLGVTISNVLLYGTAGIGFTEFKLIENAPNAPGGPFFGTLRLKENGAVYGGGIEWKIAYGLSLRGEYLHYDVGATSAIPTTFTNADAGDYIKFGDINVARAGVNISLSP